MWLRGEAMEELGTRDDQSGRAWSWGGRTQTIARNWAHHRARENKSSEMLSGAPEC